MLRLVAEHVGHQVRKMAQEAGARACEEIAGNSAKGRKELEKEFVSTYHNILLFRIACDTSSSSTGGGDATEGAGAAVTVDSYLSDILRRHLLCTLCTTACHLVLRMLAVHYSLPIPFESPTGLTLAEREKVLASLPLSVSAQLTPWVATLKGSSVEDFLAGLEKVAGTCQIHLKKLDKKKLRSIAHAHRLDFLAQMRETSDPATVLHLATVACYAGMTGLALHIPGSAIPTLLNHMDGLDPETLAALKELSTQIKESGGNVDPQLVQRVQQLAPGAKKQATGH
eukprot:TRINITY_DN5773_c0_g1_i3.p1 TRINITY_DN5773_c0_g1~~TRINITY_DN5773_c0_g1_i3.p1  ORF type:complete len:284 (-),score=47.41 TRINITY_DN5773_c0_g1_i3:69-920(-)